MQSKKRIHDRPWLTPTGVEIQTNFLREIVKSWGPKLWESYLKWYETGRKDSLVSQALYMLIGDEQIESIFEQFAQSNSQEDKARCEQLFTALSEIEAEVLRQIFMEGRTESVVAANLSRSQTGINHIKNRAISRLKRGNYGDHLFARRFMKGEKYYYSQPESSIWDQPLTQPIKIQRVYDPSGHNEIFESISSTSLRESLFELSENARRILYLRHWCNFSARQTARYLAQGINIVEQIEAASISKLKRNVLATELGPNYGGGK